MDPVLAQIPLRIIDLAKGALAQANMHAAFYDPGNEHWEEICVLNTAHAGELFIKAIIAKEHPLLIFKDLFGLDNGGNDPLDIASLIQRGKTHDFEKLPQVLWAVTGRRIPNMQCFEQLRRVRNSIQHFCVPENVSLSSLSLEFIYQNIDPLISDIFGLCAIEFHEDHSVGYDYLVDSLISREIKFRFPKDFAIGEFDIYQRIAETSHEYQKWIINELKITGYSGNAK